MIKSESLGSWRNPPDEREQEQTEKEEEGRKEEEVKEKGMIAAESFNPPVAQLSSFQPAALDRVRPAHVMLARTKILFCSVFDCLFNKTIFFLIRFVSFLFSVLVLVGLSSYSCD